MSRIFQYQEKAKMHPHRRFPELVWKNIFRNFEEPEDKLNLIKVHSSLKTQFKNEELGLQFHVALPTLVNTFEKILTNEDGCNDERRMELQQIFLTLRLVTPKSCKIIDTWMESQWKKKDTSSPPELLMTDNPKVLNLKVRAGFNKFIAHFGNHGQDRMPILSRSAFVCIPADEDDAVDAEELEDNVEDEDFQGEVNDNERRQEILLKVGTKIKYLSLNLRKGDEVDQDENLLDERLEAFKRVLQLTPNLKALHISWSPSSILHCKFISAEDADHLTFPNLPFLTHLKLSTASANRQVDFSLFEKYFPQLLGLQFDDFCKWKDWYNKSSLFLKLKSLQLGEVYPGKNENWRKLCELFTSLNAPMLTTIKVEVVLYTLKTDAITQINEILRVGTSSLDKLFKNANAKWKGNWDLKFAAGKTVGMRLSFVNQQS